MTMINYSSNWDENVTPPVLDYSPGKWEMDSKKVDEFLVRLNDVISSLQEHDQDVEVLYVMKEEIERDRMYHRGRHIWEIEKAEEASMLLNGFDSSGFHDPNSGLSIIDTF